MLTSQYKVKLYIQKDKRIGRHKTKTGKIKKYGPWKKVYQSERYITNIEYNNMTDIDWTKLTNRLGGRARQFRTFTCAGLQVTRSFDISPDKKERTVREYYIERINNESRK